MSSEVSRMSTLVEAQATCIGDISIASGDTSASKLYRFLLLTALSVAELIYWMLCSWVWG